MTNLIVNNLNRLSWSVAGLISLCSVMYGAKRDSGKENGVDFQIIADRMVYSPGSTMKIKFIVTNIGEKPLYIPRSLSECSNIEGSFFFWLLDQKDRNLTGKGCSSDVGPTWETHIMEEVVDAKRWIALKPGEIFGKTSTFELPRKKGTYRLRAELTPPGFSDKQRELLAQQEIRVLRTSCWASTVSITVK
ncbi:MAG: hypothetical protein DMG40_26185 [Acidobacteria bacterium]|nr:MAG: hypothetical protein DMG40_26185 [Acidobacteriota bacterium]